MIAIADVTMSRAPHDANVHFEPSKYQSELLHYIRKKKTQKIRRVKNFLDRNLKNPDQDAQALDRDLSRIYSRYCDEQMIRRKLSKFRPIKPLNATKKKEQHDQLMSVAHTRYLRQFADDNCNLHDELNKSADNAAVFKKVLLDRKNTAIMQQSHPPSREKSLRKLSSIFNNGSTQDFPDKSPGIIKEATFTFQRGRSIERPGSSAAFESKVGSAIINNNESLSESQNKVVSNPRAPSHSGSLQTKKTLSQTDDALSLKSRAKSIEKPKIETLPMIPTAPTPQVKPSIMEDKNILDLKSRIDRHMSKQKVLKKEIPFKHDKTFIGSRKLQLKQQHFNVRNGLITKVNVSFGL